MINIGTGRDIEIGELALLVKDIVGYTGNIENDTSKPDGTMQKLLDVTKLHNLGWYASTKLRDGIEKVYNEFIQTYQEVG